MYPTSQPSAVVNYIINYVREAENALFSSNFTDENYGWQKYLDINSFADWYLINEIAKNTNGAFKLNCIMNLKRGGKLKMGPLWDFEEAFGNTSKSTSAEGFVIKNVCMLSCGENSLNEVCLTEYNSLLAESVKICMSSISCMIRRVKLFLVIKSFTIITGEIYRAQHSALIKGSMMMFSGFWNRK